jgi:arginyl-tRNA synthetase
MITMYRYRVHEEKAEWMIYVTDVGQQLHFEMVFKVWIYSQISYPVS